MLNHCLAISVLSPPGSSSRLDLEICREARARIPFNDACRHDNQSIIQRAARCFAFRPLLASKTNIIGSRAGASRYHDDDDDDDDVFFTQSSQ